MCVVSKFGGGHTISKETQISGEVAGTAGVSKRRTKGYDKQRNFQIYCGKCRLSECKQKTKMGQIIHRLNEKKIMIRQCTQNYDVRSKSEL